MHMHNNNQRDRSTTKTKTTGQFVMVTYQPASITTGKHILIVKGHKGNLEVAAVPHPEYLNLTFTSFPICVAATDWLKLITPFPNHPKNPIS